MKRRVITIVISLLCCAAVGALFAWLLQLKTGFWLYLLEERQVWQTDVAANPIAARLLFCAAVFVYVLSGLPGSLLLTMLGGFLFGWVQAVVMACLASTFGAMGLISVVRRYFRPWARRRLGARYQSVADGFRQDDLYYLVFMRLMPIFPFWVVNLVVAVMEMPLYRFAPVSALAMLPAAVAAALVGTGLDQALMAPAAARAACRAQAGLQCEGGLTPPDLLQMDFVLAASLLALLALLPPLWRHLRRRQK